MSSMENDIILRTGELWMSNEEGVQVKVDEELR